jgi:hypothetical protein
VQFENITYPNIFISSKVTTRHEDASSDYRYIFLCPILIKYWGVETSLQVHRSLTTFYTDFRCSRWQIIYVNSVIGLLHRVVESNVADVSDVYEISIFRVEECMSCWAGQGCVYPPPAMGMSYQLPYILSTYSNQLFTLTMFNPEDGGIIFLQNIGIHL